MEYVTIRVQATIEYPIPANLADREEIYGEIDPQKCVQIDLDNDPAAFFFDSTLVNLEVI